MIADQVQILAHPPMHQDLGLVTGQGQGNVSVT